MVVNIWRRKKSPKQKALFVLIFIGKMSTSHAMRARSCLYLLPLTQLRRLVVHGSQAHEF